MFTAEVINLLVGSIVGFAFKFMSKTAENRHTQMMAAIDAKKAADDSTDKAALRVSDDFGKRTRRRLMYMFVFGGILAPFVFATVNIPVIVEIVKEVPVFFGLGGTKTVTTFYEIHGYYLSNEIKQAIIAISGFYFGQGAAK
jgi:hypothetical protein